MMKQHCSDKITAGFGIQQDGIADTRQGFSARSTVNQLYEDPALWVAAGRNSPDGVEGKRREPARECWAEDDRRDLLV